MPLFPEAPIPNRPGAMPQPGVGVRPLLTARLPVLDAVAPMDAAEAFRDLPGLALLESARPGRTGRWSYLTADPVAVVVSPSEGPDPLVEARALLARMGGSDGAYGSAPAHRSEATPPFRGGLVGFLGYDLGRRFETLPSIARVDQHLPVMRLALHDWALAWDRRRGEAWLGVRVVDGDAARADHRFREIRTRVEALIAGYLPDPRPVPDHRSAAEAPIPVAFTSGTQHAAWLRGVEAVREAIGRGEIYQANLTRRLEAPFMGDPWPLFRRLRTGDPALFAGYLDLGPSPATGAPRALLSASPEPFLSVDGEGNVSTDPIKGTRKRGRTPAEDRSLLRELVASRKDQAENVMIVDVLRNDLGRVCEPGSVRVPRLLRPERTAAVQHLVTTVTGRLSSGRDAFDLLAASFPGGSITGAPKIRAMEIIEGLEPVRRGPYCGAMVWLGPDGRLGSSILIRTLVADGERLTLHVGGGITWRSDPQDEWDETVAKARGPLGSIGAVEVEP
ncbi:MAG TPA: anthranilate synthase component I family protein [Candidatus Limnocylindrales bacterium]|nr:anthranilate synthase component I family protein [Candidatus Limnocylindrales bacterium]